MSIRRQLQASRRNPDVMQQLAGLVLMAEGVFQLAHTLACLASMAGPANVHGAEMAEGITCFGSGGGGSAGAGSASSGALSSRRESGAAFDTAVASPMRKGSGLVAFANPHAHAHVPIRGTAPSVVVVRILSKLKLPCVVVGVCVYVCMCMCV